MPESSLRAPLVQKSKAAPPAAAPRRSPMASPQKPLHTGAYTISPLLPRPAPFLPESTLEPAPAETERELSSNLQTGFNIVNNYVGIVLLSMSYCCRLAGWLNVLVLFVLTSFGAYTGALIVRSYKFIEAEGNAVPSYAGIGQRCLGTFGKWLVLGSAIGETYIAILCMNIIIWNNAALLVPQLSLEWIVVGCIAISFPANWLKDFTMLSFLSFFGIFFILLICVVVGYDVANTAPDAPPPPPREAALPWGIPMAASIMMAGLTGHVGLPPMYSEMKRPSDFEKTLYSSFGVMFAIYGYVGVCGYLLYGSGASVLITSDMSDAVDPSSWAARALVNLVLGGITFKLFCSVPMCVLVLVDIAQNLYLETHGKDMTDGASMRFRLTVWGSAALASIVVYSSLQYVTALIGINSMLISVLLPILFYVQLHHGAMGLLEKLWFGAISLGAVAFTIVITIVDVQE